MSDLFTLESILTLLMLILLQAVLGFDNLLYIAIASNRVAAPEQAIKARRWGIGLAVVLRILLLVLIVQLFNMLAAPLLHIDFGGVIRGDFTLQALVTLAGGGFIIYTAVKEIHHLLTLEDVLHRDDNRQISLAKAVLLILVMNLVFSFDSILSAMAIASQKTASGAIVYQVPLMAIAILVSGVAMIAMADYVTDFLRKNRMYEVLGLFILFLVGALLVTEGAHLAHLHLFGFAIEALSKSSFYLVVVVLVITDILSNAYQKRLWAQREVEIRRM